MFWCACGCVPAWRARPYAAVVAPSHDKTQCDSQQTGAGHIVVPDTDHTMQSAGEAVNALLEQFWSAAGGHNP